MIMTVDDAVADDNDKDYMQIGSTTHSKLLQNL